MLCSISDCKETDVLGSYCTFHRYETIEKECITCLKKVSMKRHSFDCEACKFKVEKRKPIVIPTYTFVPKK